MPTGRTWTPSCQEPTRVALARCLDGTYALRDRGVVITATTTGSPPPSNGTAGASLCCTTIDDQLPVACGVLVNGSGQPLAPCRAMVRRALGRIFGTNVRGLGVSYAAPPLPGFPAPDDSDLVAELEAALAPPARRP